MAAEGADERSSVREKRSQLSFPLLRWLVVIGAMVVNLPTSVPSYYGNLSAYTDSYFRFFVETSAAEHQTVWMLPMFIGFTVFGFLIVDRIVRKIGLFVSQIIAIVLFDLGIFLTYFTVQRSVVLVMLTLMICGGFFVGMVFVINLIYSVKIVPHQSGLASGICSSAFGLGGFLVNFLITSYLNPSNLTPNVVGVNQVYFSQVGILDNVPKSFLLIGFTNLVLHCLGLLLMHIPLKLINFHDKKSNSNSTNKEQDFKALNSLDPVSTKGGPDCHQGESLNICRVSSTDMTLDIPADPCTGSERSNLFAQDETSDLKPQEVLQVKSFYIVWISICTLSTSYILSLTYYKHFGQLWIKDDVFLTTTGSIASVAVVVGRLIVGALADRFGIKRSITLILSIGSITMSFWYFAAIPSRWLYFVWIQIICGTTGTLYVLAPMTALKLFGQTHFPINYGLVMTSTLVTSLLTPILIPTILDKAGWFGLMAVESAFSVVALTLVLMILPEV